MAAFSIGVTGLQASNKNLEVIGNNVANASTVGFKQSRVEFADVYAKSGLTSGATQAGHGVRVADISQQFNGGGTTYTQNSLDMKIDGNGFFVVNDNGQNVYTRAGTFGMDKEGFITTNQGLRVQGFPASANGDSIEVGAIQDLYIPVANIEPNATTKVDIAFNLDSREAAPSNFEFDPNDSDSYTHLYPTKIYDSLGNEHTMTQYFVKQPSYQPDLGVHTRVLETMVGFSRFGSDYFTDSAAGGLYPGDANEAAPATLDSDVQAALDSGTTTFSFADPFGGAAGVDFNDATATAAERGTQLQRVHDQLQDIITNGGHSGRIKEHYQEAYDALVEYLPGLASGSVGGTDIDVDVYEGALNAIETASLDGTNVAYGNIDILSGIARTKLLNAAAVADPLTDNIKPSNVDSAALGATGAADVSGFVEDLKSTLNALINGTAIPTAATASSPLWDDAHSFNNGSTPTAEEKATYKLALDTLNELEVTYDDGTGAVDPQAVVDVLNALESESADNRWQMHVYVDGEKVSDGNESSPDYFSFNFTEYGQLSEPLPTISIKDWTPRNDADEENGSAEPQEFTIDLNGTTQFAGQFGASSLTQDGFATGELSGLDVDKTGTITARYTNGTQQLIGQVAIANFRNDQGLTPVGGTNWRASTESGDPVINAPGVGVAGEIQSNALEDSNVDLSEELVKMILAQRDYQANAKTIQTADTLTQTIINLR
ncbi:flagellar hook-basal body complex protein [Oceanospirillum sediminis]|uniref:Flagellar hook protein FlgE n=1 Tax=Oceanospirillum sediminis TaxID=2760088 RepID=A0A839ILP5_9GAMM|nr:flagellar hook-basal body complex protein [Oceanospirillum sediminis]MBB1485624.1 flagellar hook-basal body complex protein [Oceanospirillum sediminis]